MSIRKQLLQKEKTISWSDRKNAIAVFELSSYSGIVPGAYHLYGKMCFTNKDGELEMEQLTHKLSASEAMTLNKQERAAGYLAGRTKPGSESNQFFSKDSAYKSAIAYVKKIIPVKILLLEGSWASASVQECVWCKYPGFKKKFNALYKEADALDWYSGKDDDRMTVLDKEFDRLIESLIKLHLSLSKSNKKPKK